MYIGIAIVIEVASLVMVSSVFGVSNGSTYPFITMAELSDQEKKSLQEALLALQEELSAMLSHSKEAAAPVDLDAPIGRLSRMDALQEQNMALANRQAARSRMKQSEAAVARFADDEYGDCLDCGEPIDIRRLMAKPESAFCLPCQTRREKRR